MEVQFSSKRNLNLKSMLLKAVVLLESKKLIAECYAIIHFSKQSSVSDGHDYSNGAPYYVPLYLPARSGTTCWSRTGRMYGTTSTILLT